MRANQLRAWALVLAAGIFSSYMAAWAQTFVPDRTVLLPITGGIGVGRTVQMQILHVPGQGLQPQTLGLSVRGEVSWRSSDPQVATIDARGRVTGLQPGTVTVSAQIRPPRGPVQTLRSRMTVGAPLTSLSGPPSVTIMQHCQRRVEVGTRTDTGGADDRPLSWLSSAPSVAQVEPLLSTATLRQLEQGGARADAALILRRAVIVSARQTGQAELTASAEGLSIRIPVIVVPGEPAAVRIYPDALVLDVQETRRATAVVSNAEGCRVADAVLSWQVADTSIATVDASSGEVRGLRSGSTRLSASTANGSTASIEVTVPAVASVQLNPSVIDEIDIGANRNVCATVRAANGSALSHRNISWTVSGSAVSAQPSTGQCTTVTGRTPGNATVTATSEGVSAALQATVPSVSSVSITPNASTVSVGNSVPLTATPRSSRGTVLNQRTINWSASNDYVTLSSNSGATIRATGVSPGDTTISAKSEGVSGSATVHVATYCESNVCAVQYVVRNFGSNAVDLYQIECDSASCTGWELVIQIPPNVRYTSAELTENNAFKLRAVSAGQPVTSMNALEMESGPFVGGPGIVAFYDVY